MVNSASNGLTTEIWTMVVDLGYGIDVNILNFHPDDPWFDSLWHLPIKCVLHLRKWMIKWDKICFL